MPTKPPLDKEDQLRVLDSVGDTNCVLVGGQAVAFWADYYEDRLSAHLLAAGIYTSGDTDFSGDKHAVTQCASVLGGEALWPENKWDAPAISFAEVLYVDGRGYDRQVDFVLGVLGVKTDDLLKYAEQFRLPGAKTVRVMDPITCLQSRFANLLRLRKPNTMQQARLSVAVAELYLRDLADQEQPRLALREIERSFRYALHSDDAGNVAHRFKLEAFEVIAPHDALPEKFRTRRYPQMQRWIATKRSKQERAVASGSVPNAAPSRDND